MRALVLALAVSLAIPPGPLTAAQKQRKKRAEAEITQVLELPKELPGVVVADSQRLSFHVSPLSARGLLSQQVREALRNLLGQVRGATMVKLRGFVAGSGDVRRVPAIVSETFTERRLPLPALSVVRVGALPLEGAQVVLEAVATGNRAVNPHGLAFLSGQAATSEQPLTPLAPLAEQSLARLRTALSAVGLEPKDVLRASCYLSSLDDHVAVRSRVGAEFPQAALTFVQGQRALGRSVVECEAVARLRAAPAPPVRLLSPAEVAPGWGFSAVALVGPARLALTGTQLAFGYTEQDARLAFQRLGKSLEQVGTHLGRVVVWNLYPLSGLIGQTAAKVRGEFLSSAPAGSAPALEGVASLDAACAADVIAVVGR
jgi:enamine deaminase RidA (YjgF/YER057c/UK114 family)